MFWSLHFNPRRFWIKLYCMETYVSTFGLPLFWWTSLRWAITSRPISAGSWSGTRRIENLPVALRYKQILDLYTFRIYTTYIECLFQGRWVCLFLYSLGLFMHFVTYFISRTFVFMSLLGSINRKHKKLGWEWLHGWMRRHIEKTSKQNVIERLLRLNGSKTGVLDNCHCLLF